MITAAERRRRFWLSGSQIGGYATYGAGTKATLKIGRKTGLAYNGWREGQTISMDAAVSVVNRRRAGQVGQRQVGLTATRTEGRYKGGKEPSLNLEIAFVPSAKEKTKTAFFRNVKKLAQGIASDLAQREVIVAWDAPGRRGKIDTATPSKAPSALDKKFCSWVRKFSSSARRDPSDDCFDKK